MLTSLTLQIAFAEDLLQRHLVSAAKDLTDICNGKSTLPGQEREVVGVVLHRIWRSMNGVQSCLPYFKQEGVRLSGENLSIKAKVSPTSLYLWPLPEV